MIFVSVGTQLPFDRLIKAVDAWAERSGIRNITAQVGRSTFEPRAITAVPFLNPAAFRELQSQAKVIVAHAGTGSILGALELGKPIIIMPRDHLRGEHRNAHQAATASRFSDLHGVYVARDERHLVELLDRSGELTGSAQASGTAPEPFLDRLRAYIDMDVPQRDGVLGLVRSRMATLLRPKSFR